ncbi:PREDICTED: zinc finger and SCAN domain-containing protein 2-like isoform X3 [Papilio polytes]|uniref:zinc finger and SCAN domain-containing protein 2-like isoform X3 n=1 Tax=Papilio polytes TaxID=76194 RepID=UPI000676555B|nr:PREDICTED: zinc finger and SCAN domain-containing protein 2-like isoform X3 [Papilio polytes]
MQCSVQNCTNNPKLTRKSRGITFHVFPKEPSLRTKWIEAIGKTDWEPKYHSTVCSEHFQPEDFCKTKCGLRKIKNGAIPVLEQDSNADLNSSAILKVCRICLATDRKLYHIADYKLDLPYQEITGLSPSEDDNLPQKLCWECTHRLVSCHRFRNKAIMSQRLMTDLLSTETHLTVRCIKSIQKELGINSSLIKKSYLEPEYCDIHVKEEVIEQTDEENDNIEETITIKEEINSDEEFLELNESINNQESIENENKKAIDLRKDTKCVQFDVGNEEQEEKVYEVNISIMEPEVKIDEDETSGSDSESENDVKDEEYLIIRKDIKKNISIKNKTQTQVNSKNQDDAKTNKDGNKIIKRRTMKRKNRPKYELVDTHFTVTNLTFEEQIAEISKRKDTFTYKTAPFKCDICYIGFNHQYRCDIHKMKHSKERGDYECPVCKTRMMTKKSQKIHINRLHTEKMACKRCDFVTKHRDVALRHLEWHNGATYKCPHCPSQFAKRSSYFSHLRLKHVSDFVCELCGYTFISEQGVESHKKRKHSNHKSCLEGPYCEVCEVSFASQTAYDTHLKVSSKHSTDDVLNKIRNDYVGMDKPMEIVGRGKGRPFATKVSKPEPKLIECEQCGVQLRGIFEYKCHFTETHPGEHRTQYPEVNGTNRMCDQCGKIFPSKLALLDHMWIHTGEKRFKCSLCDKSFSRHFGLKVHEKYHGEQRPVYGCKICGKEFSFPSNRKRHMIVHSETKPYKCDACEKTFKTNAEKRMHHDHVHLKKPWPRRSRGLQVKAEHKKKP